MTAPRDRRTTIDRRLVECRQEFFRFFRRRLARPEDAEDALQDFCLKALRAANTLEDSQNVDAWLSRILRNTLTDHYRRRAARQKGETAFAREPRSEVAPRPAHEPSACGYIRELLPVLKPEYREIIRRVDLEETSRQCVAAELGLTSNNVGVRLHRARRALRAEIKHRRKEPHDSAILT
ncbi:RNA polymerase sigma factor [Pelagivirga sediminicola]|nr:sigma-70 family RNA polymerase sigma factor [Pelagivirga sediminicola]